MNNLDLKTTYTEQILPFAQDHLIKIIAIFVVALIINRVLHTVISKLIRRVVRGDKYQNKEAEVKREDTLIAVFEGAAKVVIWIMASMMILSELGIDIGPLIAAAGIIGLALGFGGQYLVKDIISGLFIILENQYRVGDAVCIGDKCGSVTDVNLRVTVLRDLDGVVHYVPNGQISVTSNMSKDFSKINLDIGISYNDDLEKVEQIVNRVGQELAQDENWKDKITKAPAFVRVNEFADSAVIIKILGDVTPGDQWAVAGEFRKRIKMAFDKEGVELPFPQRVVHTQQA